MGVAGEGPSAPSDVAPPNNLSSSPPPPRPPLMSPPSMSPTSASPPRLSPSPTMTTTGTATTANNNNVSTPSSTTTFILNPSQSQPITTATTTATATNAPRLQRVEFLYTATPVEGCDLLPYVVLRTPSGEVKSAESIEAKTRGALSVQYRWNRLAATYTCATKQCFKSAQQQFVPLLKMAALHQLPKDQFDAVIKQSFFCSMTCLKNAWPTLRRYVDTISTTFPKHDLKSTYKQQHLSVSANDGDKDDKDDGDSSQVNGSDEIDSSDNVVVGVDKSNQAEKNNEDNNTTNDADSGEKKNDEKKNDGDETQARDQFENEDDLKDEYVRSHRVISRSDGVFADPLPNPMQVTQVAFIRNYAPTADDVGHVLELVCRYIQRNADGSVHEGPPLSIRSSTVLRLPDMPPDRRMCSLPHGEMYSMKTRRPGTFRVMTYNILAEIYATKDHFPEKQCPSWALAWTFRKRRLIAEMASYNSDVICLQEVQADHFEDHFQLYFQRKGYESCFKGKTRESMGRKGKIDGCATFYRKEIFNLREQYGVEYNTIAQSRTKEPRILNRVLKGNVGQILILDTYDGSGPVIIANTHLYWDPDLADVKLFQVDAFMQELELLIQSRGLPQDIPIILAGDFNSTPESSVYELLSNGACMLSKNDIPDDGHLLNTCRLRHNLRMSSTYSQLGGEPAFTNYTFTFKGVLDYIWYGTDSLVATAFLEIPSESGLLRNHAKDLSEDETGIPNEHWSSDHIALVADFQLLKRNTLPHPTM